MTLQTEGCGFESGSVRKYFFFFLKFYNLMPIVLQSWIRNLLSACYFNFDLFHVSSVLVVYLFNIFCSPRLTLVHLFWKN